MKRRTAAVAAPPPRLPSGSLAVLAHGERTASDSLPFGMSGLLADVLRGMGIDPLTVRVTVEVVTEGPPVRLATVDGEAVEPVPASGKRRKRPDGARSVAASRGWDRRREREEFAAVNIPANLLPLWEREKGRFTEGTPDDRARAFLEWAEAHERDAVAARDRESATKLAAAVAERTGTDLPREGKIAVIDAELADLLAERAAIESEGRP